MQLAFAGYSPWKLPPEMVSCLSASTICEVITVQFVHVLVLKLVMCIDTIKFVHSFLAQR